MFHLTQLLCFSGCFNWSTEIPQVSNSTKKFINMFNETMDCIKSNYYPSMNDTEEVCQKCSQAYIQLDEYYKSLSSDSIGVDSICMDIVDSVSLYYTKTCVIKDSLLLKKQVDLSASSTKKSKFRLN